MARHQLALAVLAALSAVALSTPSIPLFVKTPYLSTWLQNPSKHLPGAWPSFWAGQIKGISGFVTVDGKPYEFIGAAVEGKHVGNGVPQAVQTNVHVTPTQSIFTLHAGQVELTLNFFTPVDPTDLRLLSLPASYLAVNARSLDANKHHVQVYIDITAEWMIGKGDANVIWNATKLATTSAANSVLNFDVQMNDPRPFLENGELAEWGQVKFFTDAGVTYQAGADNVVRSHFVKEGKLSNVVDHHYRAVSNNWPVFAFARDLGQVGATHTPNAFYAIARVRTPAISYATGALKSLWEDYFGGDANKMIEFVFEDRENALKRAQALDAKIIADAKAEGGDSYVSMVSYALRQAYGGTEMVGTKDKPWMMLKEISSDGNCQTVDVIFPHFPVQYYLNPNLIKYLLDPLYDNEEREGLWPNKYVIHDLGSSYPRCIGHLDGREEAMEIEETANIITMTAAYVKASKDVGYAKAHYPILTQWAKYLVDKGLFPGDQLTTDDFLGRLKNSTNLAAKAIIGLAAMSQLSKAAGHDADAKHYLETSQSYIKTWEQHALDKSGKHIKSSYNDKNGEWFLQYSLYFDKMLETNIVPKHIFDLQDAWYASHEHKYGLPLISTKPFTKNDWLTLVAAASNSPALKKTIYDKLGAWIHETSSNAPLSDYYNINDGHSPMFINRPVVGSLFGPLALKRNHA